VLDLGAEMVADALEIIQEDGRTATLVLQSVRAGPDPDKPWKGRPIRPRREEKTVTMAFSMQRQEKIAGERTRRRIRMAYLAAADVGLEGAVPQVNDLVKVATAGDPDNCISYAIEDVMDYELEVPIAYRLTLVRQ
jgi:hypothetical protein